MYQKYKNTILRFHSMIQLHSFRYGNNNVFGKIDIVAPERLVIGNNCSFNHGCYINASNNVILGDDVTLSAKSCIVSTGIDYKKWACGEKMHTREGAVEIGNHVWIGTNATILPGVKITGEYVVIAANAVVTQNIEESFCIFAGIPARKIKKIKKDE
ncbi:acyltransferase [Streptococcus suis]|nr:acyltransferase [Streptococcus suis]